MYYFYIFGNAPLHSRASLDPGLNLLVQIICFGMRIWFLDKRPHVWEPLEFASLPLFPLKHVCLSSYHLWIWQPCQCPLFWGWPLKLETTPKLLTYLQILGFIDTYVYHIQWSVGIWANLEQTWGTEVTGVKWSLYIKWPWDNLH